MSSRPQTARADDQTALALQAFERREPIQYQTRQTGTWRDYEALDALYGAGIAPSELAFGGYRLRVKPASNFQAL